MYKAVAVLTAGLGLGGSDFIADAVAHNGDWVIFHALEDSVITAITYKPGTTSGSLAGKTIKAGDRIYGEIISLQLASGSGELYRATV